MIHFTCPGCKAAHTANPAFVNRRAKCVRCGANMYIPATDGEATFAAYGHLPNSGGPLPSGPATAAGEATEPAEEPAANPRRKQAIMAAGALVLLLVVGVAVYFLFFNKPAEPTKKSSPPPPPEPQEESKPVPPPPVYEFVGPIQPPPPPPVPVVVNADRLALEATGDPDLFAHRYAGKFLEVRGVCASSPQQGAEWLTFMYTHLPDKAVDGKARAYTPNHVPKFEEAEDAGVSVLGAMARPTFDGSKLRPRAGRPVTVRGWGGAGGFLSRAEVVSLLAPADPAYLGKKVTVTGLTSYDPAIPGMKFTPLESTTLIVTVECRCNTAAAAAAERLLGVARVAAVTGTCTGRTGKVVTLENATVGDGGEVAITSEKLIADYEVDLLPVAAIEPSKPVVKVTAAELALAYKTGAKTAESKYSDCVMELTGYVLRRDAATNTLQFETSTDTAGVRVEAVLTKAEYAALPADETTLTVRGEFRGTLFTQSPSHLRLENAYYFDPDAADTKVKKLTADFLPVAAGRRWEVVRAVFPELPPSKPTDPKKPAPPPKPATAPVQRIHYLTLPDGRVVGVQVQAGTLAADTLAGDAEPKWAGKPLKPAAGTPVEQFWVRAGERVIEVGSPKPDAKPGVDGKPDLLWQPLLRVNAKQGREWEGEPAEGKAVRSRVAEFFTDAAGRECVKVVSTFTDAKQPDAKLETTSVYARGVGEVWRAVRAFDKTHPAGRVVQEQKLVRAVLGPEAAAVFGGWAAGEVSR